MLNLLCHIFMFVMRECWLHRKWITYGVLFDKSLSMVPQVTTMCKSTFYHLRKISLICKHLTFEAAQLLVHALVTLKLDCCNLLLYGLPKQVIKQLQCVQNAAADVVTLLPKFFHNTPFFCRSSLAPNN